MSLPLAAQRINIKTFEANMLLEETSIERNDFYYGELYAMAGGSKSHNNIIHNFGFFLKQIKKMDGMFL